MCGICGIFDPMKRLSPEQRRQDVSAMMTEFAYRGPDASGTFFDDSRGVGLGHRRLSIIDLACGQQPMPGAAEDSWLTFNGEIYNYRAERSLLEQQGYHFKTQSDTEVILALYERHGPDAWGRLRGQFAFGLWDRNANSFCLVRDRIGEKPLAYSHYKNTLFFASEMKALLRSTSLPHQLDESTLGLYFLTQHLPAPATLAKEIYKLPPGHYLLADSRGNIAIKRYWTPRTQVAYSANHLGEAVDQFRTLFEESVKLCLVSDVPVGTYLSGGLDSSAVTWAASTLQKERLHSFAIFNRENYEKHPDWRHAQAAAAQLGTNHHNVFFELPELMRQIPEFIEKTDEPFEGPTALVSLRLAKAAREQVKVVLTGNGADELLGGYQFYYQKVFRAQRLWQWIDRLVPSPARAAMGKLFGANPGMEKVGMPHDLRRLAANRRFHSEWLDLIQPGPAAALRPALLAALAAHRVDGHANYFGRYLWDDLFIYHHHSVTTMPDATGMACSLEARNPFLDFKLVEFLISLDPQLLVRRGEQNKYLLVKAMESRLPDSILTRRKEGFSGMTGEQITRWIRTEGRPVFRDMLLDSALARDGYLSQKGLAELWTRYEAAPSITQAIYYQIPIWSAAMLELWYRRHFLASKAAA